MDAIEQVIAAEKEKNPFITHRLVLIIAKEMAKDGVDVLDLDGVVSGREFKFKLKIGKARGA